MSSQLGMIQEQFSDNVLAVGFILRASREQICIGTCMSVLFEMPTVSFFSQWHGRLVGIFFHAASMHEHVT